MARRYVRNVQLERCAEDQVGALSAQLISQLRELVTGSLRGEGWTVLEDDAGGLMGLRADNGSFEGHVAVDRGTDLVQVPGQATVRKTALRVAAHCTNADKKEAREQGMQTEQAVIGIGAALGALVMLAVWAFLQFAAGVIVLGLFMPFLMAAIGAAIGGGIGAAVGRGMGDRAKAKADTSTETDELHFERVAKKWEALIHTLAGRVDAFARQVENEPSKATMV
jgi:hypothetical protein